MPRRLFSVALAQKCPVCWKDTNLEVRSSPGAERKAGLSAAEPDRRRTKAWPLALAHSNAIAYLHPISRKGEPGDGKERSGPTRRSLRRPNGRGTTFRQRSTLAPTICPRPECSSPGPLRSNPGPRGSSERRGESCMVGGKRSNLVALH